MWSLYFTSWPTSHVVCVQLEYRLEQERRQCGELEKSRRKLEGDSRSTQESLGKMEKNRSGLEDLLKRSKTDTHAHTLWSHRFCSISVILSLQNKMEHHFTPSKTVLSLHSKNFTSSWNWILVLNPFLAGRRLVMCFSYDRTFTCTWRIFTLKYFTYPADWNFGYKPAIGCMLQAACSSLQCLCLYFFVVMSNVTR